MTKVRMGALVAFIIGAFAFLVILQAAFVVRVDRFAIVLQFGEPVRVIEQPGFYVRTPFIQDLVYVDKRIMEWDDSPQEMITNDKKRIYISTYARWRIVDPLRYYTVLRTEENAQLNLDKALGRRVRDVISENALDEVVRDTNRPLEYVLEATHRERRTVDIAPDRGRSNLTRAIAARAQEGLVESFGIELIDIQIKDINYTRSAQRETINQMISERMVVVERYEAEGKEESEKIRGEIEETIQTLTADANSEALKLDGEAQAQAIATKSAAFGSAPELFEFLETLRLYEMGFDIDTTIVLSTDSPLFRLLRGNPQ